jgi:hypothetical protein
MVFGGSFLFAVVYTRVSLQNAVWAMCPPRFDVRLATPGTHAFLPSVQPSDSERNKKSCRDRRGKTDEIMHETDDILSETDAILHETDRFLPLKRTRTGLPKTPRFPQGFSY